jgi:hypothetical protein
MGNILHDSSGLVDCGIAGSEGGRGGLVLEVLLRHFVV